MCLPLGGPNCNCLAVYDPVCGCDGVTYSNECEAICAGVSIAHPGECRRPCGGLTPLPPCDGGEFCKFPPGACNDPSVQGFCTEIPQACPDVWMPVCGCDGVTYGNDCEADAAGVSIAHPGPCVPNCAATRRLANAAAVYHPGIPVGVQIALTLPAGVVAVALEDAPPAGWVVSNISNGGFFDAANGKVKWGPFFAPSIPQAVSYMATPPNDTVGPHCFTGAVSLDGANQEICGEACLGPACPLMAADVPHENCDSCNAGVCTTCTNGACRDYRISLCELIGYACAWLTGCHDDLSGVTRAAFIWRSGECYCWDDAEENWFPAACAAGIGGCCDNSPGLRIGDGGSATIRVGSAGKILADGERGARSRRVLGPSALVSVNVLAPDNAMSMALEIIVPSGWAVSQISDEGKWDAGRRKVKWGPFMDSADRTVSFVVEPTTSRQIPWSNRSGLAAEFRGTVSFDGANQPINAR
ncbi:MAG: hypothetical protein J5J06_13220 [Phycisphaerae bacterium]|nr:hypothetical protein [Phycisphaerae bacterium]